MRSLKKKANLPKTIHIYWKLNHARKLADKVWSP